MYDWQIREELTAAWPAPRPLSCCRRRQSAETNGSVKWWPTKSTAWREVWQPPTQRRDSRRYSSIYLPPIGTPCKNNTKHDPVLRWPLWIYIKVMRVFLSKNHQMITDFLLKNHTMNYTNMVPSHYEKIYGQINCSQFFQIKLQKSYY